MCDDSLPRIVDEDYRGFSIIGSFDESNRLPNISYDFFVYKGGQKGLVVTTRIFHPHTIAIQNQNVQIDWKTDLVEGGFHIVRALIDLGQGSESQRYIFKFEPDYEEEVSTFVQVEPDDPIVVEADLGNAVLQALSNIRTLVGPGYRSEAIDAKGICILANVSDRAFFFEIEGLFVIIQTEWEFSAV